LAVSEPPFDPATFLDVARSLVVTNAGEAFRRSAISRAYYACYHLALIALRRKWSWSEPDYGRHRAVIRTLADSQRTIPLRRFPQSTAAKLEALLEMRERADYVTHVTIAESDQLEAIDLAEELARRLKALGNV
jgi:uncharacterized protein (UPF0332 family)